MVPPRHHEEVHGYEAQVRKEANLVNTSDKRVAMSMRFLDDDNFIHSQEFKLFWLKTKMKEFEESKQVNLRGVEEMKHEEVIAQTLKEMRLDETNLTLAEAREMVLNISMLIILGMTMKQTFLLDQVRQQDDPMLIVEFD